MNKSELVGLVAGETGVSKKVAGEIVDATFSTIEQSLSKGEDVSVSGFGVFKTALREARTGRNPITGESVQIPAKRAVKFSPSKTLRDALNTN